MENVTDRVSNPFGMEPPCGDSEPVHGYGDANADFHFIGDHPGVHGGEETGVPFTRSEPGERLQGVLHETGFASSEYSDEPVLENAYLSYLYMCADDEAPDGSEYAGAERFFDAELRAINAHILLPVGERAVEHVLNTYTSQARKLEPLSFESLHATEVRGAGFMVVPVLEPSEWGDAERRRITERLNEILSSDYRQTKGVATRIG